MKHFDKQQSLLLSNYLGKKPKGYLAFQEQNPRVDGVTLTGTG